MPLALGGSTVLCTGYLLLVFSRECKKIFVAVFLWLLGLILLRAGGCPVSPAQSCHQHCSLQVFVETHQTLDGGEVEWISSPLFLEGFYSLGPACYKLRNCFVISSLNLFLSPHLLTPLLTAFSASPARWGQPVPGAQTHNEDISNPESPSGWVPPVPPCSSSAWPREHPRAPGPSCPASPGTLPPGR